MLKICHILVNVCLFAIDGLLDKFSFRQLIEFYQQSIQCNANNLFNDC